MANTRRQGYLNLVIEATKTDAKKSNLILDMMFEKYGALDALDRPNFLKGARWIYKNLFAAGAL